MAQTDVQSFPKHLLSTGKKNAKKGRRGLYLIFQQRNGANLALILIPIIQQSLY